MLNSPPQYAPPPCPNLAVTALTLADVVRQATGDNVFKCYQCIRCTDGCPLAEEFDLTPNQVMRSAQLNDSKVLECRAIWLCASCYTCATRCPQQLDVTGVMDALCIESRRRGVKPGIAEIANFNRLFMRSIKIFGRAYELGLMASFNLSLRKPFRDIKLGLRLFFKGKLKLLPHFGTVKADADQYTPNAEAIGYYPGCSLSSTSVEYGRSVEQVASALDLQLVEPKNWSCCGSSAAHSTDAKATSILPMSTIARIEQMGLDTVTSPCSACFSRLKHAEGKVSKDAEIKQQVDDALDYDYQGTVNVQHLLDVMVDRIGLDRIINRVSHPLKGLKLACYYGCLITRPALVTEDENPEYPQKMDRLIKALGAETVDWSRKTECCGGSLGINQTEVAAKMMRRIMDDARACGAEAMVTMCPICHLNLDSRQADMGYTQADEIPIFQATQLMSLAFGLGGKGAAIRHNLTDAKPYLLTKGIWT